MGGSCGVLFGWVRSFQQQLSHAKHAANCFANSSLCTSSPQVKLPPSGRAFGIIFAESLTTRRVVRVENKVLLSPSVEKQEEMIS
jgi:hypothetical protein